MSSEIKVRECSTIDDFETCIALQREAFGLPDVELSPRRHFVVSHAAGGWTLGAFVDDRLVGFVHHLVALRGNNEIIGYSHMMAVAREFQNRGVGAILKWAQRNRALSEGRSFIRWTWDPMQARNAHFNLYRLGVTVRKYAINFYGTDYASSTANQASAPGIDSDRLIAEWELNSEHVVQLSSGNSVQLPSPDAEIAIPADWLGLINTDPFKARSEQLRVRDEFARALADGLVAKSFVRDDARPRYLLYRPA
jgi:predicted GNAT superfamily acetyltransferase